jgi:hypothetical protein
MKSEQVINSAAEQKKGSGICHSLHFPLGVEQPATRGAGKNIACA